MKISEAFSFIKEIRYGKNYPPVFQTAANELKEWTNIGTEIGEKDHVSPEDKNKGVFNLILAETEGDIYFHIDENGTGCITVSRSHLLFGFLSYVLDCLAENDIKTVREGMFFNTAFQWQRSSYDFFLTQEGRIQRNMDKETYIRQLASLGFTHVEVNGLAFPMALETGPKGETYHMFYTYCPALDQFVYSQLNKGIYPHYYLSANLSNLKTNARLAIKYGLVPGLLCFEPRSVPEAFFSRYPMLRGARVDHPFRSFKPRYNMTIAHPLVKEHYREMMSKLMKEVPEIGFISIWTNDSGAGFEYTKSLYVGRNGGAYLIREWKEDEEIARAAGENALRFFYLLRDAGRKINPGFRVITRMESFYGEHDTIWKGLGDQVDVETASLIAKGWEMPYSHPRYPESSSINGGTVYQCQFDPKENVLMKELETRDSYSHFYFAVGPYAMFAPLLGIPYPLLTYQRLKLFHQNSVGFLAHSGGTFPPELVPFNVNHEISRVFQFNPGMNIQQEIEKIALKWTGNIFSQELKKAWQFTEEAILAFPNITPLYSTMGFAWYRLWARPLVPNIEAIDREERAYYEDFMCTTPHNPNNVDLSRDVLFQLTTPEKCRKDVDRIDENLWKPIEKAIEILSSIRSEAWNQLGNGNVIEDQYIRLNAIRCWFMTLRNVAAWIAGVYGFLETEVELEKEKNREFLQDAMKKEIENSKQLLELLASGIEFMVVTDMGETPLIHGNNLKDLLQKRITLMETHMEDEPFIDPLYIEKKAGKVL